MKHKLTLTDEEGVVINQWVIEDEFGDLAMPLPRMVMLEEIISELKKAVDQEQRGMH